MSLYTKGKIIECVEIPQYVDKVTKEVGDRQFLMQVMSKEKLSNGNSKNSIIDIKVNENQFNEYKTKIGKDEVIELSLYSKSPISLKAV